MRLVMVITTLRMGGAQRAVSLMANYWAEKGDQVCLLTFDSGTEALGEASFFALNSNVTVRPLDLMRKAYGPWQRLQNSLARNRAIRRAIAEFSADAVLSFTENANIRTLIATAGLGLPVVVCERTDPAWHRIGSFWSALRILCYPFADAVVVQTDTARRALPWPARRSATVIPNVVQKPKPATAPAPPPPRPLVLSASRFAPEKGCPTLLRAFALATRTRPGWHLAMLGEGPEHKHIADLGASLGLGGRLILPGAVSDVGAWLGKADLFALASRYEGFPNALCEALALGVPAVATASSGSSAIIRPGVDGFLTPIEDVEAMAEAMGRLMDDEILRNSMSTRAPEILNRFGLELVMSKWDKLLRSIQMQRKTMGKS